MHAIPFTADLIADVQTFDCGSERWSIEVSEWLKGRPEGDCSLSSIKKGTDVWLYKDADELIGFGSLGTTFWKWPTPNGPKTQIGIIPACAVQTQFQHKPDGVPREERYSYLIMGDLIQCARDNGYGILGLFVESENGRARSFYTKLGFTALPDDGKPYIRMFVDLK
ncbi:MAG: GNAT family N-acetyltransferase [Planctomycetota bacterium]|nr:GNAT family N-acetyltransferase [Planctomycetota bacterium]